MNNLDSFNFNTTPDIRFGSNILISSTSDIKEILGPRILIISDPTAPEDPKTPTLNGLLGKNGDFLTL